MNWWEDTVVNLILGMDPNAPLDSDTGQELHQSIMSMLVGHRGPLERDVYGIIFDQVYLLPGLVMSYLYAGSPQHLYQSMKKYVLLGLMKIYWSKPSDKIIPNSICIIF